MIKCPNAVPLLICGCGREFVRQFAFEGEYIVNDEEGSEQSLPFLCILTNARASLPGRKFVNKSSFLCK